MNEFIVGSECNGKCPKHLMLNEKFSRSHLVNKMLENRDQIRIIEAPHGYGKSYLAAHYCKTLYYFKNVMWIDCTNPCFKRDVDDGAFVQFFSKSTKNQIVVFDNLPSMKDKRLNKFINVLRTIRKNNIEIIITLNTHLSFKKIENDVALLDKEDLLLTTAEQELDHNNGTFDLLQLNDTFNKFAIFKWGEIKDIREMYRSYIKTISDTEIIKALYLMFVFASYNKSLIKNMLSSYKYKKLYSTVNNSMMIDIANAGFCLPKLQLKDVDYIFKDTFLFSKKLANRKNKDEKEDDIEIDFAEFGKEITYLLNEENNQSRLCEFVQFYYSPTEKIDFLRGFGFNCFQSFSYLWPAVICNEISQTANLKYSDLTLLNLWCTGMLISEREDREKCYKKAIDIIDRNENSTDSILASCFMILRCGSEEIDSVLSIISCLGKPENITSQNDIFSITKAKIAYAIRAVVKMITAQNPKVFEFIENFITNDILVYKACACVVLKCINIILTFPGTGYDLEKFIIRLQEVLDVQLQADINSATSIDYILTYIFLEQLHIIQNRVTRIKNFVLESVNKFVETVQDEIYLQKTQYELYLQNCKPPKSDFKQLKANSKEISKHLSAIKPEPTLKINIFGGVSVCLGDKKLVSNILGRKNVRMFLTLMALCQSSEINKNMVSTTIWPSCNSVARRKNVNCVWSSVMRAFELDTKENPYFKRTQDSYIVNTKLVKTDFQVLKSMCQEFNVGTINKAYWQNLAIKNQDLIETEILPSEQNCLYINSVREQIKEMVIESLITASKRLLKAENYEEALWFANQATLKDLNREDAYKVLMKAQIKCSRVSSALETFIACENMLKAKGLKVPRTLLELKKQIVL